MRKNFAYLILLVALFVGLNLNAMAQSKSPPYIVFIETDAAKVVLPCKSSDSNDCANEGIVRIRVTPITLDFKIPNIKYEVSGGRIIGKGELVKWDLRGVKPGNYTVTAEVEEKDGIPQKGIYTITVVECENCLNTQTQTVANKEDVTIKSVNLELDKMVFCPWGRGEEGDCDKKRAIKVSVFSPKAEKEGLDYYYLVDGGEIIGNGANVVWDFSKARLGKYKITVGVGKNSIITGQVVTKSFTFEACNVCDGGCSCQSISVSGPASFDKRGDYLIFTAELRGNRQENYDYKWNVSNGVIVFGQGTKQILVKTNKNTNSKIITATLEINGQCYECPREFSTSTEFVGN